MAGRGLTEVEDARRTILASVAAPAGESVALGVGALGRVLFEDVVATHPVPAFDNSAMDGFAVRAPDLISAGPKNPVTLRLVGESRAGRPAAATVGEGQAVAISTGAMMPEGADAVLRVEEARVAEDATVQALGAAELGLNVRRAGEDVLPGQTVLRTGTPLGPAELGVLASLGRSLIRCVRRPRLSVLVTGDELLGLHEAPREGAIRDTSTLTISALACCGGAEVVHTGRAEDDAEATREAVAQALEGVDIAVACGGVSVGDHDHVRPSLAALGVSEEFWGLALKPGSPAWFGRRDGTLVFGLPGNPVSAMVTFVLLVGPVLRAMLGRAPVPERAEAILDSDYEKPAGRAHAVRCRLQHARGRPARAAHRAAGLPRAQLDARRRRARDRPELLDRCSRGGTRDDRVAARVDLRMSVAAQQITVQVRLFAMLRERAGAGTAELRARGRRDGGRCAREAGRAGRPPRRAAGPAARDDRRQPRVRRARRRAPGRGRARVDPARQRRRGQGGARARVRRAAVGRAAERARRGPAGRRDRRLPGRDARDPGARLRGVCRDGRRADRGDPSRVRGAAPAVRCGGRASCRARRTRRAERGRRGLRSPSRGSVRGCAGRHRRDQGPRRRSGSARSAPTARARGSRARYRSARERPPR